MRDLLNQMQLGRPAPQESPMGGLSGMAGTALNMFMGNQKQAAQDAKTQALIKELMAPQGPGGLPGAVPLTGPLGGMGPMSMPAEGAGMGAMGMTPIW